MRRMPVGVVSGVALVLGLCGCGPLSHAWDPAEPSTGNLCCRGLDRAAFDRLAGTPSTSVGGRIALEQEGFVVTELAVARSSTLPDAVAKASWAYSGAIARPGPGTEVVLVLLRVDRVPGVHAGPRADMTPEPDAVPQADVSVEDPSPGTGELSGLDLLRGSTSVRASTTVVMALTVSPKAAVTLSDDHGGRDAPRLDLRTGRVVPRPAPVSSG